MSRLRSSCAIVGPMLLSAAAAYAKEQDQTKLPRGLADVFVIPAAEQDQYGNPVVTREGGTFEPMTGWPYEVWLREPRMEFVLVLPGEFAMGLDGSKYSAPAHRVRITKPFYLGKYEVTQAQWQQVMRAKPRSRARRWWPTRDAYRPWHQRWMDRLSRGPHALRGRVRRANSLPDPRRREH